METLTEDSATVKRAEEHIKKLGMPLPSGMNPAKPVEWPSNVAELSPDQLAEHMTWWSGWASFTRYHYARSETNAAAVEKELHLKTAELLFKMGGDYKTVTETKAAISIRPDVQLLEAKYLEADSMRRMLRALLEGYEGKFSTVSREITRRGHEWEGGNEGGNSSRFSAR